MSTVSSININILERPQSKEAVQALLHAVLFHRLFGNVKPQRIDVLDTTFPGVDDPEIDALVKTKVDAFLRALDTIPGGNNVVKKGQIVVVLSEKKQKKMIIFTTEEEVPWEQWVLTIEILPNQSQSAAYATSRPTFAKPQLPPPTPLTPVLLQILTHVSSVQGRDAVPPITTGGVISPFPYRIDVRVGDQMIA